MRFKLLQCEQDDTEGGAIACFSSEEPLDIFQLAPKVLLISKQGGWEGFQPNAHTIPWPESPACKTGIHLPLLGPTPSACSAHPEKAGGGGGSF